MAQRRKAVRSFIKIYVIGIVILLAYIVFLCAGDYDSSTKIPPIVGLSIVIATMGLCIWFIHKKTPTIQDIENLPNVADMMEMEGKPAHRRYRFFVKNGRWGVYDFINRTIVLPADYDYLVWKKKGSRLFVTQYGRTWEIKI